jgi:hypothetical protein
MGCPRFDGPPSTGGLFSAPFRSVTPVSRGAAARGSSGSSPTPNPGDVAAQPMTQLDRGLVQRPLRGRRPELKLVTPTAAPMAIVPAQRHVHRETAAMLRPGLMQRTAPVPLHTRSARGREAEQAQHLLHRDLTADSAEVDTGHGDSSLGDGTRGSFRPRALFPGNRNDPPRSIDHSRRRPPTGASPRGPSTCRRRAPSVPGISPTRTTGSVHSALTGTFRP